MTQKCLENGQEVEFLKNYKCRQAAKERWAVMGTPSSEFEIIQNTLSKSDNRLIVSSLCEITGVSRSGYYNWLKSEETRRKRDEQDKNDFELILACPIRKAKPYRRMLKAMRTSHFAENLLDRDFTGLGARKVLC
jgi:hypothetical protein